MGKQKAVQKEWMTSDELHTLKDTTRAWLREKYEDKLIRRRTLKGYAKDGTQREKYLYNVEDVEREMSKLES